MANKPQQCKAMNDTSYFVNDNLEDWEMEDEDYVPGQGLLISQSAPCRYVAQPGKDLCLKHQYMVDQKIEVEMVPEPMDAK